MKTKTKKPARAAEHSPIPVLGFKGGDPVAIGRLGGLKKGVNAKKKS